MAAIPCRLDGRSVRRITGYLPVIAAGAKAFAFEADCVGAARALGSSESP